MLNSQPKYQKKSNAVGVAVDQAAALPGSTILPAETVDSRQAIALAEKVSFPGIQRLVVLIPDLDTEEARLSRHIWSLAAPQQLDVLLVSLVQTPGDEFHALRRLTAVAAITRDAWVKVDTQVLFGHSWAKAIKPILGSDDMLVCPEGHLIRSMWGKPHSLSAALSNTLKRPVHLIPDFFQEQPQSRLPWMHTLTFWAGMFIVLAAFFFLEVDVSRSISDWTGQVILIGLILVEIGALYWWTSILG